jgi:hypothetical protein
VPEKLLAVWDSTINEGSLMESQTLAARVMPSPTAFLVDVIECAPTCARACADHRAFSAADQTTRSRADRSADSDSLSGFTFAGLGIVTATMPVRISSWHETTNQNDRRKKKRHQS